MVAAVNGYEGWIKAELILNGPLAKPHFRALEREQTAIEGELGHPLEWSERPEGKESRVTLRLHGADPNDRAAWADQYRWFQEHLEALHRVFAPRIRALKVEETPVG